MTRLVESFPEINGGLDDTGDIRPLSDFDDLAEYSIDSSEDAELAEASLTEAAMARCAIGPGYDYEEGEDAWSDLGGGIPGRTPVHKYKRPESGYEKGIKLVRAAKLEADKAAGIDVDSTDYRVKNRVGVERRGRRC